MNEHPDEIEPSRAAVRRLTGIFEDFRAALMALPQEDKFSCADSLFFECQPFFRNGIFIMHLECRMWCDGRTPPVGGKGWIRGAIEFEEETFPIREWPSRRDKYKALAATMRTPPKRYPMHLTRDGEQVEYWDCFDEAQRQYEWFIKEVK